MRGSAGMTWCAKTERIKKSTKRRQQQQLGAVAVSWFPFQISTHFYLFWWRILPRSGGRRAWSGCSGLGRPLLLRQERTRNFVKLASQRSAESTTVGWFYRIGFISTECQHSKEKDCNMCISRRVLCVLSVL